MDDKQTTLFPNNEPIARAKDFNTSHLAAEELTKSGARGKQKRLLLDGVKKHPGRTSRELAGLLEISNEIAHKRLPDLREDGFLYNGPERECSVTRRQAVTWFVRG